MYDVIIIGMGIGGITAGIYAKRSNLNVLMIDKGMPGGLLNSIDKIENYPGLIGIKGIDFADILFKQIQSMNIPYKMIEVVEIKMEENCQKVITAKEEWETKNIILATGRRPKFLGLDNEKDLLGRGISTCATCDANFYQDEIIAVVGAGNSALQESLYLANIAKKVYILNRKDAFPKAEAILIDEVKKNDKIEIIYNVNIKDIHEEKGKIASITLDNDQEIAVKGVFIYIGYLPNSDLVKALGITDEQGYILVNEKMETSINGLYAIGDVIKKDIYQLVTATSEGATVINSINKNQRS